MTKTSHETKALGNRSGILYFKGRQCTGVVELCIDPHSQKIWEIKNKKSGPVGNKKYLFLSANTLQFKMVCNREVDFMEILVVWGVLKYVPFCVDFVKWASIINCRRVTRNSLVLIKNGLCRIASCFRKNNLCLNFSFPDTCSLVYYHSSPPFKIDLV